MLRLLLLPVIISSRIFSSFLDDETPNCPDGFKYCNNAIKCLMVVNVPKTYFAAQYYCSLWNSTLTSIQDDYANNALCYNCNHCPENDYWIGLTNLVNDDCDTPLCWLDHKSTFRYQKFTNSDYLKLNESKCVSYRNDHSHNWNLEDCDKKLPYICGSDPTPTQAKSDDPLPCAEAAPTFFPFSQPPPLSNYNPQDPTEQAALPVVFPCPDGWSFFSKTNSCYSLFFNATYSEAEAECQAIGAHLASIHSKEENKYIADLSKTGISQYQNGQIWIGLKRTPGEQGENEFETLDDSHYDYQEWANGQPDNYEGMENCVELYADPVPYYPDTQYGWNDCPCDDPMRAFVCKKTSGSNVIIL